METRTTNRIALILLLAFVMLGIAFMTIPGSERMVTGGGF